MILKGLFKNDIINVASGEEISIAKVATTFFKDTGVAFSFGGEIRKGDPTHWVADISQLNSLGFKREVSFEEGIKKYRQWLKENE